VIEVRALGACEIQIGRKRITLTTEVPFALAFYLTMRAGEVVTRDDLAETFWGSKDPAKARHSLRQTLYKLRQKGLEIDEGAEEIRLDPAQIESDVVRALSSEWPASATRDEVVAAQELLPGLTRQMAAGFMEWLDSLRSQVAAAHRRAALAQITRARREARWADLEVWARQVLRTDPLNEEATLARAESAAMAGSKAAALEILDTYMAELGDNAPRIGLPASVLRRRIAERQPEWATRGPREVALIGRAELMSRLTGFVEDATLGRGGCVMLLGAAGVGKTRLAMEVLGFAELRGFRTVLVRADSSHAARPLSTILALLPGVMNLPGALTTSPGSLSVLQRMLRQGGELPVVPVAPGADAYAYFLGAFRDLFRAVAEETRSLLLIDDAHNMDDSSAEIVAALIGSTANTRMQWTLTCRGRDSRWDEHSRQPWIRRLAVPALSDADSLALAQKLAETATGATNRLDPKTVARFSGGNPLFVRELSAHRPTPDAVTPMSLVELMQDRLSRFSSDELQLMRTVALLGQLASASRVCRALNVSPRALSLALESLEQEGVVRLGTSQSLEVHECWRSAIVDALQHSVRAALSLDCAQLIEQEIGTHADIPRLWHAAGLFADAGERDHARRLLMLCAEQMMRIGMSAEAITVLQRAQTLTVEHEDRLEVTMHLARAHYIAGGLEECVAAALAADTSHSAPSARVSTAGAVTLALLVDSLTKLRRDHRGALTKLASVATDASVPNAARLFASLFGIRAVFNDAQSALEGTFRRAALEISQAAGPSLMGLLVELVWTTERGSAEEMVSVAQAIAGVAQHDEPLNVRSMALRYQGVALRTAGQFDLGIERATQAFELSRTAGLQDEMGLAAELLSFIHLDIKAFEAADYWIKQWQSIEARIAYPARTHAIINARARLEVELGHPEVAIALYEERLPAIESDSLAKRRIADVATIAFASACIGDAARSTESARRVADFIRSEPVAAFLDFPAEMVARAMVSNGESSGAHTFAIAYVRARDLRLPMGLPPCCSTLREFAAAAVTRADAAC
jgi:DNA-binding SARP family transcriptional activator